MRRGADGVAVAARRPNENPVFHAKGLSKTYHMGEVDVHALRDVDLDIFEREFVVFTQEDATIVPTGALFRHGDQWNVYVVKNGRAQVQEVQVLRRSGRLAAIASGLNQGEAVVIYPSDRIASGVRVVLRQPSNHANDR
jgi:hypothetical protein